MKLARIVFTSLTVLSFFAAGSLPACSSEEGGTTGKRITLAVKVAGAPETTQAFTNAMGWNITLSKAVVSTGALYFYDGATIFSRNAPRAPSWRDTFGIKSAFAHPGHYVPGNARGELLAPSSVDLRTETVIGDANGVSGMTRSATFSFQAPPAGPLAGELTPFVAVFEGTATKGAETRIFRAEVDAAEVMNTKNAPAIEGCPFTETDMQSDGTVTVTIKVGLWFDQVELDAVPASTDGKPVLIGAGVTKNGLTRGMKAGLGYQFAYAPSGPP
ncbi:MAG: hypothetical protein KF819_39140 [Labilithrix sp.]|nr:hypothetical protein [Labilithrix sp.]